MSDESQDKKATVPDLPPAKSYSTDGVTVEFDPGALQVHAISPELRQQMSETELPRLDPKYLQDTAPPNLSDAALATASQAATITQPSLRRLKQVALPDPEPTWRRRGVQGLTALLVLALLWEVTVLVRASFSGRETSQPEPRGSVPISPGAPPRGVEATEPATALDPGHVSEPGRGAPELPAPASPRAEAPSIPPAAGAPGERAAAARDSSPTASPPPAAAQIPIEAPGHSEASVIQKPGGAAAPQPASSSKSASKVLFPPQ